MPVIPDVAAFTLVPGWICEVVSWRNNWARLTPFLSFPPEIRRIVYTTNTIESLSYQARKVLKSKGHFPSDEAAMKLIYLALRNAEKKWLAPHRDWKRMYAQFVIYFGDRIPT